MPDKLESIVDDLARAVNVQELRSGHEDALRAVRIARRQAKRVYGPLAQTYAAALVLWDAQKADGGTLESRVADFAKTLKVAWPQSRGEPWHYYCDRCDDTGLVMRVCRPGQRCNGISNRVDHHSQQPGKYRSLCAAPTANEYGYEHTYGEPCLCDRGRRFQVTYQAQDDPGSFTKSTKGKSGFSRFGR